MGYERKRGKLADLNALLRGGGSARFSLVVGETMALRDVQYVITLDTDTRAAARLGAAVRRRDGASAQSPAFRGRGQRRQRRAGDRRVRDTAAAREHQPARREPLVVRAPARRRPGHRSVHARRLGRLPGRVRRGVLHRQGDLRRRRVRARAQEPLSREPDPEPRPARGLLRAVGAAERRAAVRGIPVDLRRGHQAPAPLDARRLATRRLAAESRPRPRQTQGEQSAVAAFAVEALRQPAAQSRPGRVDRAAAARVDRASPRVAVDAGGARDPAASFGERVRPRPAAEARRGAAAAASRLHRRRRQPAPGAIGGESRLPALRGGGQPRRDRAHRVAHAGQPSTAARVESVGRRRAGACARRRHDRPIRAGGVDQVDGDFPDHRRGDGDRAGPGGTVRAGGSRAGPAAVAGRPGNRLVAQPAAGPPRSAPDHGTDALPAPAGATDLGVLRDLRRSGRPLAAAGQLPGASGRPRRASHFTDEHGLRAAGESDGLRLRLHPGRTAPPADGECAGHDGRPGAPRRPLLQLVRHAVAEAAAAALRLGGGQREPRRSPADAATGTAGAGRRRHRRSAMVRRAERHAAARSPTAFAAPTPASFVRLQRELETAYDSRPATIAAARQWLDRIEAHVTEVAAQVAAQVRPDRLPLQVAPRVAVPAASPPGPDSATAPASDATASPAHDSARAGERRRALGGRPRPPVPDDAGRAGVSRAMERPARPAGSALRPDRQSRHSDLARGGGARDRDAAGHRAAAARGRVAGGPRVARRTAPGRRRSERPRRRADGRDRAAGTAMRRTGPHGVRLSVRPGASPAGHRLQRRRAPARSELLRPARLGSEILQLRGDRAGTAAAGKLVRARAPAHDRGGPLGAPVVERVDVRVPDAAAGDADLRQHAARPDLSPDRRAADRVRQAARGSLGHLGVRLQRGRREPQLPVPRVRRARPGAEARTRRGSRRGALRVGARADGGARGGVPQPATARGRRARRKIRPLRGRRLHAGAPAARPCQRRRALVHGAPPGHDPALALAPAARPADAEALRVGPAVQGDAAAAAGAAAQGRLAVPAPGRAVRDPRRLPADRKLRCA